MLRFEISADVIVYRRRYYLFEVDFAEVNRVIVADTLTGMLQLKKRLAKHKSELSGVLANTGIPSPRSKAGSGSGGGGGTGGSGGGGGIDSRRMAEAGFMAQWDALDNALLAMNETLRVMEF